MLASWSRCWCCAREAADAGQNDLPEFRRRLAALDTRRMRARTAASDGGWHNRWPTAPYVLTLPACRHTDDRAARGTTRTQRRRRRREECMAGLLALARAIDRFNEFIGKVGAWLILRRHPGQRRQRDHPQGVQHVVQRLAGAAMVSVRRGLPAGRRLHAASRTNTSASTSSTACSRAARSTGSTCSGTSSS